MLLLRQMHRGISHTIDGNFPHVHKCSCFDWSSELGTSYDGLTDELDPIKKILFRMTGAIKLFLTHVMTGTVS